MRVHTPSARHRQPSVHPGSYGAPVPVAALDLLALAHHDLAEAELARDPAARYVAAHLGALHAAAAVLAVRARPARRRGGPRSAWTLLAQDAPELSEWAAFFAAGAGKRAAAEAGLTRAVTARDADDLLRDAATFLGLAETTVGVAARPALPELARPAV